VFGSWHNALLWTLPLVLAILLRLITLRFTHELIFPAYFFCVPVVFYIVVACIGVPMDTLRASRWVFDVGTKKEPWYRFYTCYDFRQTHWGAFWKAMPTQFACVRPPWPSSSDLTCADGFLVTAALPLFTLQPRLLRHPACSAQRARARRFSQ
jgi:hypothetical protein